MTSRRRALNLTRRYGSLSSISEMLAASSTQQSGDEGTQTSDAGDPPPLRIVHQTDNPNLFVARRIRRAEALVPVVTELRQLLEVLLSELFFHKCSLAQSGIFFFDQTARRSRLSPALSAFLSGDPELNAMRDDDNIHNTTYFNAVSNERMLAVLHALASIPNNPVLMRDSLY